MENKKILIYSLFFVAMAISSYASDYLTGLTYSIADKRYCMQNGNCNISNMTINQINYTYSSVNITENLNVEGNVTAYWFKGFIDFSWIQNWNWNTVYAGIATLISSDYYDKTESDNRFCNEGSDECGTGGSTTYSSGTEGTSVYALNSKTNEVIWNVSQSENEEYKFYVYDNVNLVPIGGVMQ